MAIRDDNIRPTPANPALTPQQAQQFQQATPPPVTPQPTATMGQWSFHGGMTFGAAMSPGMGSDALTKLQTSLNDIYKEAVFKNYEITLIPIDNTVDTALFYSAIVVCARIKAAMDLGVGYHILILEATGDKPSPIMQTIYQRQVEITRVSGDAMDEELHKRVLDKIQQQFPNVAYRMADACIVPVGFNPEDKNLVRKLAFNSSTAGMSELMLNRPDFQDYNLAYLSYDSILECKVVFSRESLENTVGEPMRSDIVVRFVSQKNVQQDQRQMPSLHGGDREQQISLLSGFIDTVYAPLAPTGGYNFYQPQQYNMPTQRYAARLIVTHIDSHMGFTPALDLLWLATAMAIRDDNNWVQALRPTPNSEGIDLYDIGALNIDANMENSPAGYGSRISTKTDANFGLPELGRLITSLYRPGLIISMDVPECGPSTWYLSVFKEAAEGNPNAQRVILEAANTLTNGIFGKYFTPGKRIFVDLDNRIHLGYYIDSKGIKRDIRTIDYLAVANMIGDRDPASIRTWSDTFFRTEIPLVSRLATRKTMIEGLTQHNAVFTGYARRVTFSTEFMEDLVRSCIEAGLRVRISTPTSTADFNQQRGIGNFVNEALLAPGQSFMDRNYGYSQAPNQGWNQHYWRR